MKLLSSLVYKGDLGEMISVNPEYLKPSETIIYKFIESHIINHGVYPAPHTVEKETTLALYPKKGITEPPSFYREKVYDRHITTKLNSAMMAVRAKLEEGSPRDAVEILLKNSGELVQLQSKDGLVDFRDAEEHLKQNYSLMNSPGPGYGITSGWVYLDARMGRLEPGDLLSIVGRPSQGKTFLVLRMMYHAWKNQKIPVLVVSPEMKPIKLIKRLTALHTKSPLTPINQGSYNTSLQDNIVYGGLAGVKDHDVPFYIVDGAMCPTIEDLFLLSRQLGVKAVGYDGAYLMKHRNPRLSKWDRISESAQGLKNLSSVLGIPVVASYQFSRDMEKKSKSDKKLPTLADIYGSDEIGQLSSIVLGLLQEETIETALKKEITLLKGRDGEEGSWWINWLFDEMNFSDLGLTVEDIAGLPDNYVHYEGDKQVTGTAEEQYQKLMIGDSPLDKFKSVISGKTKPPPEVGGESDQLKFL
ncbi:MAG: hypothetical protein GWN00_01265 [Aliifodinibius sp.]|nr:hypothetical protein [Fodinibius sp.]NIY23491.1 hypothetical protein [Fodinibius sp.]